MIFKRIVAAAALLAMTFGPAATAGAAKFKLNLKLAADGKVIFDRECAACHGISGKGDGEAAYLIYPKPRDFTSKVYKFRSTFQGDPPRRSDIVHTLRLGLPGSTMPSFISLPDRDLKALAEYVLSLSDFEEEAEEFPNIPAKIPPSTSVWVSKGKKAYLKYGCNKCHGDKGDGKGESAPTLRDYKKRPIPPNDYTRGVFKGGGDARSIITRIQTGIEGTPMPSHAETMENETDLIAIAHYVRQFSKGRDFWQPGTGMIPARRVSGEVPTRTNDERWQSVAATVIPMMQIHNDGRPPVEVDVRALHSEKKISIRLEWDDSTPDRRIVSTNSFADGSAIQFSLREQDPPLFIMGSADNLVNIWYWNAAMGRKTTGVEAKYPGMAVDDYPFAGRVYPRRKMGHAKIVSARATKKPFISAWAAKNPNSSPFLALPAMELNAAGFGTLRPQAPGGQHLKSTERWWKGKWRVVFTRSIQNGEKKDVKLRPGTIHPIAFAVWDGSRGDRNGQKSVTTWYKIRIE
ncbi:MAG: c-type cytochrome [Nitrospinaceae bacterium]|nr:c-type cytochrome [Nitrospinaceae bacterium]MBT4429192.1 c-type cytochrome [Nitrospinaceae bacterium]MBT5368504.1 c-type cytochrome [Nitrospinaceae bacterium]MBT5947850.1 c-type cytochrome [Nitrospinaceae bacterium]MBT6395809.1 c-type cytochrome [Nitrospinaceae bacterium]